MEEINVRQILFLAIFIVLGVVLFNPIISEVNYLTHARALITHNCFPVHSQQRLLLVHPQYVGSSNAPIVQLVRYLLLCSYDRQ
uniref:Structural protein VP3 n=1 Tax=Fuselloviridae sp. TaxID=2832766 RepID=Q916F2_9VIRU|nr:structural protein VP3 [unidentified Fusellovirus]